ncbi:MULTISPECIES: hypothetical protein [unclassified Bartonella]
MNFISYFWGLYRYTIHKRRCKMDLGAGFFKKAHELATQIYSV